jgi:hypothetical protein
LPDGQTTRSFYDAYGRLLATKLYATAGPAATAVEIRKGVISQCSNK